jgi:hypothetical protein
MESYLVHVMHARGWDLRAGHFSRARIVYRKPCFRGDPYRRVAWWCDEDPPRVVGAIHTTADAMPALPAVAVELTIGTHEDRTGL